MRFAETFIETDLGLMFEERLKQVADLLEGKGDYKHKKPIADDTFNLNYWCKTKIDCGTVACACGHAACDPWFMGKGFTLSASETDMRHIIYTIRYYSQDDDKHYRGNSAVKEFFGLSSYQLRRLFLISGYRNNPTPKVVAKKIRAFLNDTMSLEHY